MAITKSAQKALRQSLRRKGRNLMRKKAYKKAVGDIKKSVLAGKYEEARQKLPLAYHALDKAAKRHAIKKNKASRLKSRLARLTAPVPVR
jgi:small subunit ribosomal protein S20